MGEVKTRRVLRVIIATQQVGNLLDQLHPGTLVVTSADRDDIVIAAAMAQMKGVALAGILFAQATSLQSNALAFCQQALERGLPVLQLQQDCYQMTNLL
ncbi:DRTGG domain-containing protein, partial [Arthrospira platensis SPKY1]|nr:DRTGG domain-containing protein [Arthrospira platensis SPKY1]